MQRQNGGSLCSFLADERQELIARLLVMAESSEHRAGNGLPALFLDATHLHAQMTSFHNHTHALRSNLLLNRLGNLAG